MPPPTAASRALHCIEILSSFSNGLLNILAATSHSFNLETIRRKSQHPVPFVCRFVTEKNCSIGLDLTFFALWGVGVKEERVGEKERKNADKAVACESDRCCLGRAPARGPGPGSRVWWESECPEPEPHLPAPVQHAAHPSTRATLCKPGCYWSKSPVYRGQQPIGGGDTLCLWGQQFCDWVWLGDALRVQLGRGAAKKRMRGWVAVTSRQWTGDIVQCNYQRVSPTTLCLQRQLM